MRRKAQSCLPPRATVITLITSVCLRTSARCGPVSKATSRLLALSHVIPASFLAITPVQGLTSRERDDNGAERCLQGNGRLCC
ncbi:hypothetical protein PXNS11_420036 [Stutzerimonas xanthomarina]|nr:hypothetical protein PXNS11_420036 [Stutzerimonas xanthomarina]